MNFKIVGGLTLGAAMLLGVALAVHSQEPPRAPEPREPALTPIPPGPPELDEPAENYFWLSDVKPRLGVSLRDVTAEKAKELKLPGEYGAIVARVDEHSAAARAGLQKGDVILEFAGQRVWSVAQFRRMVNETPADRTVPLQVSRSGQLRTFSVKLESPPNQSAFAMGGPEMFGGPLPHVSPIPSVPSVEGPDMFFDFRGGGPELGISGDDLTSQLAGYFGVKQGKGVLVREVEAGSAAEKGGIKAGDVIVGLDGKKVGSVDELREALPRDFEGKKPVMLDIVRDRQERKLTVELEAPQGLGPIRIMNPKVMVPQVEELKRMAAEASRQAGAARVAAQRLAQSDWLREQKRCLEETRHSLELLKQDLQKQKLQMLEQMRQHKPAKDVV